MHYEYGRALGVTCFFDEAERELNLAFELDKQSGQPLYMSLNELALLNLAQRKFAPAVGYFEHSFPELDRVNGVRWGPTPYADLLTEYAAALSGVARTADAETALARAGEIKAKNLKTGPRTDRTPYGKHCYQPPQ